MIPKIIHYCWFGGNKKPKIVEKCIKTWKKYCPDYEIKEWNESNFDVNCCQYVQEAYESKKWAFVSDYARFYILNFYGGVYVDTDVELLKPLDGFLDNNFTAFETATSVATGLIMASDIDNDLCKYMLNSYENEQFITKDGSMNLKTVCTRVTEYFIDKGLVLEDRTQSVNGYIIYNTSYFNPTDMDTKQVKVTGNTVSIHHYAGTWVSKGDKFRGKTYSMLCRILGKKNAERIRSVLGKKK